MLKTDYEYEKREANKGEKMAVLMRIWTKEEQVGMSVNEEREALLCIQATPSLRTCEENYISRR